MSTWSIGSVADFIQNTVENVPTNISGARLLEICDKKRVYVERYTGQSIGSTAIAEKYQAAITYLAIADTLTFMNIQGVDANIVSLGDLSIHKGATSNVMSAANNYKEMAKEELKALGKNVSFYQAYG